MGHDRRWEKNGRTMKLVQWIDEDDEDDDDDDLR
jgi:hypothetical protein